MGGQWLNNFPKIATAQVKLFLSCLCFSFLSIFLILRLMPLTETILVLDTGVGEPISDGIHNELVTSRGLHLEAHLNIRYLHDITSPSNPDTLL